jgi:translation initiation factor eIF-2B subunit epsilon
VKQGYAQENAVVELQGLKMAENRTFADIARYVLMTIIGLTLPAHGKTSRENVKLYPETAPASTPELLKRLRDRLKEWAPLLARFLKSEDDQVEALLTFEEFCLEDEVFKGMGGGACVSSFPKVLHMLYDMDVISEESVLAWAEEKAEAEEHDKKFLKLAQPFIDWLNDASEDEDSSEDESDDE